MKLCIKCGSEVESKKGVYCPVCLKKICQPRFNGRRGVIMPDYKRRAL